MRARKCLKTRKLLIGSPPPPLFPILAVGQSSFRFRVREEGGGGHTRPWNWGCPSPILGGEGGREGGLGSFISRPFLSSGGKESVVTYKLDFGKKVMLRKTEIFFQRRNSVSKGLNSGTVTSADNLDLFIDISKTPCFPAKFWDLFFNLHS